MIQFKRTAVGLAISMVLSTAGCFSNTPPGAGASSEKTGHSGNGNPKQSEAARTAGASERKAETNQIPLMRRYRHLRESKSVLVNGAEFVALADAEWIAYNPPHGRDRLEVQLRITNRSDKHLLFPTFDTFGIAIKTPDAEEVKLTGGRKATLRGAIPVLIDPGANYCLCRKAEIYWDSDRGLRFFGYEDGTGSGFSYGPLKGGKYTLNFWYENAAKGESKDFGGIPVWVGKAVTDCVPFDVLDK